jgi:ABC-type Zn2+ transport system substrate-binding protein/surface adhesin
MNYDNEIKKKDLITQYLNQVHSKQRAETEILKIKANIQKYDATLKSLDEEIAKTKKKLSDLGFSQDDLKSLFLDIN